MRAHEFINEDNVTRNGKKPNKNTEATMTGAHRAGGSKDRGYDLNRLMQYVASSDGESFVNEPDDQSWVGRNNTAHPYTKEEARMLKHAYKAQGLEWDDVLKPNPKNKSVEPKDTSTTSPIKPFGGY
jgi:hypothetical protein